MTHPDYRPVGETHYYLTPREMDLKSGKGPGTHDHDAALCGDGSFHFRRTKVPSCVTCTPCRAKLGLAPLPLVAYEVMAYGFDGSTDATDDRVLWVNARNLAELKQVLAGTRATYCDTLDSSPDVDFTLPEQAFALKAKLLEFEKGTSK